MARRKKRGGFGWTSTHHCERAKELLSSASAMLDKAHTALETKSPGAAIDFVLEAKAEYGAVAAHLVAGDSHLCGLRDEYHAGRERAARLASRAWRGRR
jgi:hypothetical protein